MATDSNVDKGPAFTPALVSDAKLLAALDTIGFTGDKAELERTRRDFWTDQIKIGNSEPGKPSVFVFTEGALYVGWAIFHRSSENNEASMDIYFSPIRDYYYSQVSFGQHADQEMVVHKSNPHE